MRIKLLFIVFLFFFSSLKAQQYVLSPQAKVSVLTIGQGSSLNDSFGHNAFRITDSINHIDAVFNYGVYDFKTPNFYTKFAQGKLNYLIGLNYYEDFFESYMAQNRTIEEQVLNLTLTEKQHLLNYLLNNIKPENRAYLYDFFYDNCATKIRDVLEIVLNNKIDFKAPDGFEEKTFRTLIQDDLNKNSWGSFGIDLALGSVIDKKATLEEHMFLPEYIHVFFGNAILKDNHKPLVKESSTIYKQIQARKANHFFSSPLFIFGIIGLLILFITYKDYKKHTQSKWLDLSLFSITGSIGVLILLLWFATDHKATHQNYNLLWACVLNLFVIRQFFKNKVSTWFIKYLKLLVILLCLLVLHWMIGVQVFAIGLIPLLIVLSIRYLYLIKYYTNRGNSQL